MCFDLILNIIRTCKGQTNKWPLYCDWYFIFVITLSRDTPQWKMPLFIEFFKLQSPAVCTGPIVRELLVFLFPPQFFRHFSSLWPKAKFSSLLPSSHSATHSFDSKQKLVSPQGVNCAETSVEVSWVFWSWWMRHLRFACDTNSKSKIPRVTI